MSDQVVSVQTKVCGEESPWTLSLALIYNGVQVAEVHGDATKVEEFVAAVNGHGVFGTFPW